VYILRSLVDRTRFYTGVAADAHTRLAAHNAGRSAHTARGGPWELDVVIQFTDEKRALAFERYLKSGSGVAFSKLY
jgi:predicted GIY-YIG superfamily endonuclease